MLFFVIVKITTVLNVKFVKIYECLRFTCTKANNTMLRKRTYLHIVHKYIAVKLMSLFRYARRTYIIVIGIAKWHLNSQSLVIIINEEKHGRFEEVIKSDSCRVRKDILKTFWQNPHRDPNSCVKRLFFSISYSQNVRLLLVVSAWQWIADGFLGLMSKQTGQISMFIVCPNSLGTPSLRWNLSEKYHYSVFERSFVYNIMIIELLFSKLLNIWFKPYFISSNKLLKQS